MTSLYSAGGTQHQNVAASKWTESLQSSDDEYMVAAAAMAIPPHLRSEVLAQLQALIRAS